MAAEVVTEVNLKEAEELARSLGEAINSGDAVEAAKLSRVLSRLSVPVTVGIDSQAYSPDTIRLRVGVEDAESDNYVPVTMMVSAGMTIAQLKEKINQDFGFHPLLQRWVIGKRLARDGETLGSHGVRRNGDQAFLFICSAHAAHLTRHQYALDQEQLCLEGIVDSLQLLRRGTGGAAVEKTAPPERPQQTPRPPTPPPRPPKTPKAGWVCTKCTYLNTPLRPGCEMCAGERPANYQVPENHQPDQQEIQLIQQEQLALMQYEQAQEEERNRNYLNLLATEEQNLITSTAEEECPICLTALLPGEGIVLRECLHTFCSICLRGTILNSRDAEVSCPEACDSKLLDREISALLTDEEHQRFLELRLSIAESCSEHSFHCQTINCRGWCVYEDEVNEFRCELCYKTNCILCRAIHDGMDCKAYQDDLRVRAENDIAAQQTKNTLEAMLRDGEAMKCPRCDIIIQKKDGCDWLCCLMCKMEICWVTKQARWGPNGTGDTSGGCKCRVNAAPCHPNCQNCH